MRRRYLKTPEVFKTLGVFGDSYYDLYLLGNSKLNSRPLKTLFYRLFL